MSDVLDIHGGAGGFQARYEDMVTGARIMREAGNELLGRSDEVARIGTDGDLLASGIICPDKLPGVLGALTAAGIGPDGALVRGTALSASGVLIEASMQTYLAIDSATREAFDRFQLFAGQALGFGLGLLAPGALLLGGVGGIAALGLLATNPALRSALTAYVGSGKAREHLGARGDLAQRTLYENPWMQEALTRALAGLIPGFAHGLAWPFSPLLTLASGGNWPPSSYEESVAGLLAIAGLGGMLKDHGHFHVSTEGHPLRPAQFSGDHPVESLFQLHQNMDADLPSHERNQHGQVQIVTVYETVGNPPRLVPTGHIVQIPGTEVWDPKRGVNPVDLPTNVNAIIGQDTVMRAMVQDALDRAIERDGALPVMLTGHSQGGIVAGGLASDPEWVSKYNVQSVLTGGSPIGRMDIDSRVSVLALEHKQDPVPMLDGQGNPDRTNWTTVRRDLPPSATTATGVAGPIDAHGSGAYANTGALIDSSQDPSIVRWREENAPFLHGGPALSQKYDILPGVDPGQNGSTSPSTDPPHRDIR